MTTTSILAIIGAVTGVTSLLLQLKNHIRSNPKLKISLDTSKHSYYFLTEEFNIKYTNSKYCAAVSLKITNTSSSAVTISECFIQNPFQSKVKRTHNNELKFQPAHIIVDSDTGAYTYLAPTAATTFPIRLEPFDTKFIGVRFSYFDNFIDEEKQCDFSEVKLFLSTSYKNFPLKVKLHEYHKYYDLRMSKPR